MNFKSTLVLIILVLAGGVFFWVGPAFSTRLGLGSRATEGVNGATQTVLETQLTPEKLTRIEMLYNGRSMVLERAPGGDWTLPGKWPTRTQEVNQLVGLLTGLRSRFAPITVRSDELAGYGLKEPEILVTVRAGQKDYRLAFSDHPRQAGPEAEEENNRFSRPTWLRLDDNWEIVRLAPGIIASLDRPEDYYQQRRLFPSERVARDSDSPEKVERLIAREFVLHQTKNPLGSFSLVRQGNDWELNQPVHDHVDPDKLKSLIVAVPDIWAEQFVDKANKDLSAYGLKEPEQTLRVVKPSGEAITLLVGKQSKVKTRTVTRPAPPGGPPQPPQPEIIHDVYRYAKLENNNQIFEIRADKLKDVDVSLDSLRDARLARFRAEDARRLEIQHGNSAIVLTKESGGWRLQKPLEGSAEGSRVSEILDKLAGLEARDKDVLDKSDPKADGLDKPLEKVQVTVEEGKQKKPRTFVFEIGKRNLEKSKLYIRVAGLNRVNVVDDSLLKLTDRPALAYRGRRVLDFTTSDLARIEIDHGNDKCALEQAKDEWKLASPVHADADSSKVNQLASDLGRLEAIEFVSNSPTKEELDNTYGLGTPASTLRVSFTKPDKKPVTLLLGKQRGDKPEYFAKIDSSPAVFVVKKETHDLLNQGSLAFRPLQLWQLSAENITEIHHHRAGQEAYHLKREGQSWKITAPFEAAVVANEIQPMITDLAILRGERYEAHTATDLAKYGLDKPYLELALQSAATVIQPPESPKKGKAGKESPAANQSGHVLFIGKPTGPGVKSRFAKLENSLAIFVVGDKWVADVDRSALDLLDRNLLSVDAKEISRIRASDARSLLTLRRDGDKWRVETAAAQFPADAETMASALGIWSNLRATRIAAYGPKTNDKSFGLDTPSTTVTLTLQAHSGDDKKSTPRPEHTLTLGKPVPESPGERYARLDQGPAVAVLSAPVIAELTHSYLDFADRNLLQFESGRVSNFQRHMGDQDLEMSRVEDGWRFAKTDKNRPDNLVMDNLVEQLAHLSARRIAAYEAKDLKPFGLDDPTAVVTVRLTGGKDHVLTIGKVVEKSEEAARGDRFARVDQGNVVAVLPGEIARKLVGGPLQFRDHNLVRFADADKAVLVRGPRQVTFFKVDGTWKVVKPLETDADQSDLEEFINATAKLRADQLVTTSPDKLKAYGLDQPTAHWRLFSGDKEVLNLLVGSAEKADPSHADPAAPSEVKPAIPRHYAKLGSGNLVFLLDSRLSGKALAEYRSRTLWSSLDSAQIEKMAFRYEQKPFTLEKVNSVWQVQDQPEVPIKSEVVTETLDALSRLKAEAFVADKNADWKLFGLEPPELSLEIQTPTGRKVLHVGRREGGSKRYYARVVEENRSDVFVMAENDATKILRHLNDFRGEKQKSTIGKE